MVDLAFELAHIEPHVYRVPIDEPVVTSFGVMTDRPALFIRVVDRHGNEGWGEVWCNFPSVGAEHRARLIQTTLSPLLCSKRFETPRDAWTEASDKVAVLAIQSGEPGPLAQALAGIDIAIWDMLARRAGLPVYRLFSADERAFVKVYASGLNADRPERLAAKKAAEGYTRFKIKVGFRADLDERNLAAMRDAFGPETDLMVDANQAWDLPTARAMADRLAPHRPLWLEEPVRGDTAISDWVSLAEVVSIPLANGENIRGEENFAAMATSGAVAFLQPDIGKWGGFSGCLPVVRQALEQGVTFCPHWLGGGIGLIASQHLLAAAGGDGFLEVDANPNPLRDDFVVGLPAVAEGEMKLTASPGLGVVPDLKGLQPYRVAV